MNQKKRVVVTGMGVVSCYGTDVDDFYEQLLKGKSGITKISGFSTEEYPTKIAGEIKEFDAADYIDKKNARRIDKFIAYGIVAGKKALEQAQIPPNKSHHLNNTRCGIIASTGMGGMGVFSENVIAAHEKGPRRINPFFIPFTITNMAGALIAIDTGFMGPNYSVSTACASGSYAIMLSANHIRSGEADLMLCGGTEAAVNPIGLGGFCAIKALSQQNEKPEVASRPWDKSRDGFVLGEGAGFLVLESLEHALNRGATIYAEYLGGALTCDAHHITEPAADGSGVGLAVQGALRDANIEASRVNYINAHATSTLAGDMAEIEALKKVIPSPDKVVINATKSLIGHSLGAAGGFEAIATVKAIQTGKIHPTLNLDEPEDGLSFIAPKKAYPISIDTALSNSFGFGGHNATLVFGPYRA
ncbi:MAG: beta-ketoacyl-ACP synthase II [Chlamydiales bacterium]